MDSVRTLQSYFNRLLPFTTPGTPIYQDIIHTLALCALLYYAPEFFENRRRRQAQNENELHIDADRPNHEPTNEVPPVLPELDAEENDPNLPVGDGEAQHAAPFPPAAAAEDEADDDADEPGPANPQRRTAQARNVGAKKAKSIARRDQRRAYHEFQRSQGEAQRARDAADAEEREAELLEEKRRRAVAEAVLEEKARKEREERREKENKARQEEVRTRDLAIGMVRKAMNDSGAADLGEVASKMGKDRDWVERLVRADGMVGNGVKKSQDGTASNITMITAGGWVVKVDEAAMREVWSAVMKEKTMKVTYADMATKLESVVRGRITT
ncbi:hypothetical protein K490DRAFT_66001 [Saccharata proteae CBS 121410]|uniref:Uncharacterized protein n=1 Tax=Saccharata proteae CBS 121410 TaxID=1314787 RepID=A0A9P4LX11_9PEZI|nr:hypothetical protein K490DRAFT_66001 [Saccharata proteae CBS 121410]